MVETLQFILSSPSTYLGTLGLILVLGFALDMALSPFGRPRIIIFNDGAEGEDDGEENGDQD